MKNTSILVVVLVPLLLMGVEVGGQPIGVTETMAKVVEKYFMSYFSTTRQFESDYTSARADLVTLFKDNPSNCDLATNIRFILLDPNTKTEIANTCGSWACNATNNPLNYQILCDYSNNGPLKAATDKAFQAYLSYPVISSQASGKPAKWDFKKLNALIADINLIYSTGPGGLYNANLINYLSCSYYDQAANTAPEQTINCFNPDLTKSLSEIFIKQFSQAVGSTCDYTQCSQCPAIYDDALETWFSVACNDNPPLT